MSVKIGRFGRLQDVATGWRTLATMGLISCSTSQNDGYFFWLYPYEKYGIDKEEFFANMDKMADDAMASGSPSNTIKELNKDDLLNIYKELWK